MNAVWHLFYDILCEIQCCDSCVKVFFILQIGKNILMLCMNWFTGMIFFPFIIYNVSAVCFKIKFDNGKKFKFDKLFANLTEIFIFLHRKYKSILYEQNTNVWDQFWYFSEKIKKKHSLREIQTAIIHSFLYCMYVFGLIFFYFLFFLHL